MLGRIAAFAGLAVAAEQGDVTIGCPAARGVELGTRRGHGAWIRRTLVRRIATVLVESAPSAVDDVAAAVVYLPTHGSDLRAVVGLACSAVLARARIGRRALVVLLELVVAYHGAALVEYQADTEHRRRRDHETNRTGRSHQNLPR
jgi:hypothetical protein